MLTPGEISMVQGLMVRVWSAGDSDGFAADLAGVDCWASMRSKGARVSERRSGCAAAPLADKTNDLRFMGPLKYR
jgi:hypothetical protein